MPYAAGVLQVVNRSCSKTVVGLATLAVAVFRTKPVVLIVIGALLNSVVGKMAKKLVNQSRPPTSSRTSQGMPSSHANSLAFWTTHLCLWLPHSPFSHPARLAIGAGLTLYSAVVCYTRVYIEGDHTLAQILAGALLGCTCAVLWHMVMNPVPI